jgi:hypothetical protein
MMYLGNDLVEAVTVNVDRLSQPGYLGQVKRALKQKYTDLIRQSNTSPEFLVGNLAPIQISQGNNKK